MEDIYLPGSSIEPDDIQLLDYEQNSAAKQPPGTGKKSNLHKSSTEPADVQPLNDLTDEGSRKTQKLAVVCHKKAC